MTEAETTKKNKVKEAKKQATVKAAAEKNKQAVTFESAMKRLEEIVNCLESGKATLDESLQLYEEGIHLVSICNNRLDEAEQKIKMVHLAADGTRREETFLE